MGKTEHQRELLRAYKERPEVGGVCAIGCAANGKRFLIAAPNPDGQKNRFDFSVSSDTCIFSALAADWKAHGPAAFTFEVLETLEKQPEQTSQAFRADLESLRDIWREKLLSEGSPLY